MRSNKLHTRENEGEDKDLEKNNFVNSGNPEQSNYYIGKIIPWLGQMNGGRWWWRRRRWWLVDCESFHSLLFACRLIQLIVTYGQICVMR